MSWAARKSITRFPAPGPCEQFTSTSHDTSCTSQRCIPFTLSPGGQGPTNVQPRRQVQPRQSPSPPLAPTIPRRRLMMSGICHTAHIDTAMPDDVWYLPYSAYRHSDISMTPGIHDRAHIDTAIYRRCLVPAIDTAIYRRCLVPAIDTAHIDTALRRYRRPLGWPRADGSSRKRQRRQETSG